MLGNRTQPSAAVLSTLIVILGFVAGWIVLMSMKLAGNATDLPRYHEYGAAMHHGLVPYRDFRVEYPPLALATFVLPSLVASAYRGYRIAFEVLMAVCGAGVIVALGVAACPVAESSRIADFFADEGAGQCGPCVHGLDAIAHSIHGLATGTAGRHAHSDLERWLAELPRRGACQHPDGAAKFISSSLRTFAADFADHARHGPCDRCRSQVLPTPAVAAQPGRQR